LFLIFRLWLAPYFETGVGPVGAQLQELASTLAPTIELDDIIVYRGLQ
jgi:hypothetical protein